MTSGTHAAHPFGRDPALISEGRPVWPGSHAPCPHTHTPTLAARAAHAAWGNDMGHLFFARSCSVRLCLPNTARARARARLLLNPHSSGNERALNGDLPRELSRQGPQGSNGPLWLSFFIYLRSCPTLHRCSSLSFTLQAFLSCAAFNGTPLRLNSPTAQHLGPIPRALKNSGLPTAVSALEPPTSFPETPPIPPPSTRSAKGPPSRPPCRPPTTAAAGPPAPTQVSTQPRRLPETNEPAQARKQTGCEC